MSIDYLTVRFFVKYKITEYSFKNSSVVQLDNGVVVEGPIENALLVLIPREQVQQMIMYDGFYNYIERTTKVIKEGGWSGEVLFFPDDVKFAKFEPVTQEKEMVGT